MKDLETADHEDYTGRLDGLHYGSRSYGTRSHHKMAPSAHRNSGIASSCASNHSKTRPRRKGKECVRLKPKSAQNATILVVDDDPIICDVIRDVLEPAYTVERAIDGFDAAKKIETGSLDLLIMDYHLPGFDGKQLYEWVAHNYPSLKRHIIFSTGDRYDEGIRRFIESTGCPCLYKPFSNSNLRQTVSETLGI
jgi:CheY-like chemotaxis protein